MLRNSRLVKSTVLVILILVLGTTLSLWTPPTAAANGPPLVTLGAASGNEGSLVTVKVSSLNPTTTYTVCFSQGYYYCSIGSSVPNTVYSFTGSQLVGGKTLTVPEVAGGQYFVVVLSPSSTFLANGAFFITGSVITYPNTAGAGSTSTLKATNLVAAATYTVCFVTSPTSGCATGTSATGSALAGGTSVTVPDIAPGLYYVNVESAISPPSSLQVVATSSLVVTSVITLGATNGLEGASVTIKLSSLNPTTTYTVCFSQGYYYCSIGSSVANVQYSLTGSTLTAGTSLTVPEIAGGQYYVVVMSPSSTLVTNSAFFITGSVVTYPSSGTAGSSHTMKATNLVGSATYTVCFETSPTSGCASGTSKTGSALAAGTSVTVPGSLTSGTLYFVTIESTTSPPSSLQIVATSAFTVTGGTISVETLGQNGGLEGSSATISATNLVASTTYTVCFSQGYYYCSIGASVPNVQYSLLGSTLTAGTSLTVPEIAGGQYFVVILTPSSTLVSTGAFFITPSVITYPNTAGVGSTSTIKANNLVAASTYTVCFETSPTSGCATGTSATGTALSSGVSLTVPDLTTGIYFVNIESATSPPSSLQIVATSSLVVTSAVTLGAASGNEGVSVTVKLSSLNPTTTYTVCFSQGYYYCSISSSVPNVQYSFTGSQLVGGKTLTVPEIGGGQYYVVILTPSSTYVSDGSFSITPSVITFGNTAGVGSTSTIKATKLVSSSTYTVCFVTSPTAGCATGTSATGSALAAGVSVTVPDVVTGIYYVNIESATSPPSSLQIVATSPLVVTSFITLGTTNGLEGASLTIKLSSLNPTTTYTVCFSQGYYYCSISASVPNVQYSFTGAQLVSGQTLTVPEISGGQYFVVIQSPSSTAVSEASFFITGSTISFPSSAGIGLSAKVKATNLVGSATYTVCFVTSPTAGCATGTSATGSALAAGVTVTVPDIAPGLYFVNIESATSPPSSLQIVATSSLVVTSAGSI